MLCIRRLLQTGGPFHVERGCHGQNSHQKDRASIGDLTQKWAAMSCGESCPENEHRVRFAVSLQRMFEGDNKCFSHGQARSSAGTRHRACTRNLQERRVWQSSPRREFRGRRLSGRLLEDTRVGETEQSSFGIQEVLLRLASPEVSQRRFQLQDRTRRRSRRTRLRCEVCPARTGHRTGNRSRRAALRSAPCGRWRGLP